MRIRKLFPLVLSCLLAAGLAPAAHAAKTIFFGGVASQASTMARCYPNFVNIGYPADNQVSRVINMINADPGNHYMVAGHSSGAKYANAVATGVRNKAQITLVDIDGFAPRAVPKAVKTVCWRATNGRGLYSRNAGSMTPGNGCDIVRTQVQSRCTTAWCLHFAPINLNVPGGLNDSTWISQGYRNCAPNHAWAQP